MLAKMVLGVLCALIPSLGIAQTAYAPDGPAPACLTRFLPKCVWASTTTTDDLAGIRRLTIDWADNRLLTTKNADGSTDQTGYNPRTGARWENHYEPSLGLQWGYNKRGQLWTAPLNTPAPFGARSYGSALWFETDEPLDVVDEPNEDDLRPQGWWNLSNLDAAPPTPPLTPAEEQAIRDEDNRERAERQRELTDGERHLMIGLVMSQMQPGSLATLARTVARQRCLTEQEETTRAVCMTAADQK